MRRTTLRRCARYVDGMPVWFCQILDGDCLGSRLKSSAAGRSDLRATALISGMAEARAFSAIPKSMHWDSGDALSLPAVCAGSQSAARPTSTALCPSDPTHQTRVREPAVHDESRTPRREKMIQARSLGPHVIKRSGDGPYDTIELIAVGNMCSAIGATLSVRSRAFC